MLDMTFGGDMVPEWVQIIPEANKSLILNKYYSSVIPHDSEHVGYKEKLEQVMRVINIWDDVLTENIIPFIDYEPDNPNEVASLNGVINSSDTIYDEILENAGRDVFVKGLHKLLRKHKVHFGVYSLLGGDDLTYGVGAQISFDHDVLASIIYTVDSIPGKSAENVLHFEKNAKAFDEPYIPGEDLIRSEEVKKVVFLDAIQSVKKFLQEVKTQLEFLACS